MYHHKRLLFILIIFSLFALPVMSAVQASAPASADQLVLSLADLGFETDETVVGIQSDRVFSINWPEGWKPEPGNVLKLSVSHSPALKASSSVVVDWNGVRLGSMLLKPDNADRGTLEVEIPENLIVPGYNALKLVFYMGIHDDFCEDINNPAIWATVHSASTLALAYSKLAPVLDLGKFPAPFVEISDLVPNIVTFVVADPPSEADLNAIAIISTRLGKSASYRVLTLDVISGSAQKMTSGNLIYVATVDRLVSLAGELPILSKKSETTRLVDLQKKSVPEGAGVLWEQVSPVDPNSVMLVVTGETDASLLKAASALGSPAAYAQLSGPLGIILEVPKAVIADGPVGQVLTLQDLGYADVSARGFRNQTINFKIPLSLAWQISSEIPFDIHFAHSTLLHEKQSAMNILINGTPVSNFTLNKANSEDAWTTVRLPARFFKVGDNQLTIQSNTNLIEGYVNEEQCGKNYEDEAWVSVFSDSRLHMPAVPAGVDINLLDYPYSFIGDLSLSQLALVVPEKSDLTIAKSIALITGRLGRYSSATVVHPVVLMAQNALAANPPYPYQILIGMPSANTAIQAINDSLPLPFKISDNQLQPNLKLPQVVSTRRGYLQTMQTEAGEPRLVVSGTDNESLLWAVNALSDPELMVKLKRDAALLESPETIVTFQIREPKKDTTVAAPVTSAGGVVVVQPVPWVQLLTSGFVGLTVLVFVVLWLIELVRRRQVKKDYETL